MSTLDYEKYDYVALARKLARSLPRTHVVDWEDLRQEMFLAMHRYRSFKGGKWAALMLIRRERLRCLPISIDLGSSKGVRQDIICEAYHLIQRWPLLYHLMTEESGQGVAEKTGISKSAANRQIGRIRKQLRKG